MSYFRGGGGGGHFPRGGGGGRMPHTNMNTRFGILPLMRPNVNNGGFIYNNRGGMSRGPRPMNRGGFRTPGRGQVIRMGPSKPVEVKPITSLKPTEVKTSTPAVDSTSSMSVEEKSKSSLKSDEVKNAPKPAETKSLTPSKLAESVTLSKPVEVKKEESISTQGQVPKSTSGPEKKQVPSEQRKAKTSVKVKEEPGVEPLIKVKQETPVIKLDEYNSELHIAFEDNHLEAANMQGEGFEYMWGGVRATHGVSKGKVCFEVHLLENLKVDLPDEKSPHVARIGWSIDGSEYQLGEDKLSWGYGGTGKSSSDSKFLDYGKRFGAGDTITCYIDLDATPKAIFYMLNGDYLGVAFRFTHELGGKAVYPHISIKNMKFRVNFGGTPPKHNLTTGFLMIQTIAAKDLVQPPPGVNTTEEAEIIMMVGLPASGKSYWCEKYAKEYKEKKLYILGTNTIIDRMKVTNLTRKRNYHGRWEELIKRASAVLNKLFEVAKRRPKNYILDQTNVYFTARRRKMEAFKGYKRIAAVIINKPETLRIRSEKQKNAEGKIVPEEAIMEMKRNYTLPEIGPTFDDVWYLEETMPAARELVELYRTEGDNFKRGANKRPFVDNTTPGIDKKPRMENQAKLGIDHHQQQSLSVNRGFPPASVSTRKMEIDTSGNSRGMNRTDNDGRHLPKHEAKKDDRRDSYREDRECSGSRDRRDRDRHVDSAHRDDRRGPPPRGFFRDDRRESRDRGRGDSPRRDGNRGRSREQRDNTGTYSGSFRDDRPGVKDASHMASKDDKSHENRRGPPLEDTQRSYAIDENRGDSQRDETRAPQRDDIRGSSRRDDIRGSLQTGGVHNSPRRDDIRAPLQRDDNPVLPRSGDFRDPLARVNYQGQPARDDYRGPHAKEDRRNPPVRDNHQGPYARDDQRGLPLRGDIRGPPGRGPPLRGDSRNERQSDDYKGFMSRDNNQFQREDNQNISRSNGRNSTFPREDIRGNRFERQHDSLQRTAQNDIQDSFARDYSRNEDFRGLPSTNISTAPRDNFRNNKTLQEPKNNADRFNEPMNTVTVRPDEYPPFREQRSDGYISKYGILGQGPNVEDIKSEPRENVQYQSRDVSRNDVIPRDLNHSFKSEFDRSTLPHDRQVFDRKPIYANADRETERYPTGSGVPFRSNSQGRTIDIKTEETTGYTKPTDRYGQVDDRLGDKQFIMDPHRSDRFRHADERSSDNYYREPTNQGFDQWPSRSETNSHEFGRVAGNDPSFEKSQTEKRFTMEPQRNDRFRCPDERSSDNYYQEPNNQSLDQRQPRNITKPGDTQTERHFPIEPQRSVRFRHANDRSSDNYYRESTNQGLDQWQSRSIMKPGDSSRSTSNDAHFKQSQGNKHFTREPQRSDTYRPSDERTSHREPDRFYQQPDSARREMQLNQGQKGTEQYHSDQPYTGSDGRQNTKYDRNEDRPNYALSSREETRPYSSAAAMSTTNHSYLHASQQSFGKGNDRMSTSYQTQMTTSTANYNQHGYNAMGVYGGSSSGFSGETVNSKPPEQKGFSQYGSQSTGVQQVPEQKPFGQFGSQAGIQPGSSQPPLQNSPLQSSIPPTGTSVSSYEKQQEDYQKAYSLWYANYAQAFAQLSQQQPK